MAAPTAPDPDVVAEAYRLTQPPPRGEDMSLAQVALRLGVSKATAGRYVQQAIAHMPYVDLHNRAKQQGDMAQRLSTMLFEAHELAHERRPATAEEPIDDWLALKKYAKELEAQLEHLLGLTTKQPLDVRISRNGGGNGDGESFDHSLIAALARLDARDALDDRELRAGRPGVIEGGTGE